MSIPTEPGYYWWRQTSRGEPAEDGFPTRFAAIWNGNERWRNRWTVVWVKDPTDGSPCHIGHMGAMGYGVCPHVIGRLQDLTGCGEWGPRIEPPPEA